MIAIASIGGCDNHLEFSMYGPARRDGQRLERRCEKRNRIALVVSRWAYLNAQADAANHCFVQ